MLKIRVRRRWSLMGRETVASILLAAMAVFPELPVLLRAAFGVGTVLTVLLDIDFGADVTLAEKKRAETIKALRGVVSRQHVWTCNWRVILYRLGHPGDTKLYAAAIFHTDDSLPVMEGWKRAAWPNAPWMQNYIRLVLKKHMQVHGWSLEEHPNYIYRQWDNNAPLPLVAAEILEAVQKTGIPFDEMTVEKIGDANFYSGNTG